MSKAQSDEFRVLREALEEMSKGDEQDHDRIRNALLVAAAAGVTTFEDLVERTRLLLTEDEAA